MDLKKTGLFIAALRRERNLTQKELAEKIGVTDKAISRWETGKGFPEISILQRLAEALQVSVTELINGEKSNKENMKEQADLAVVEMLSYAKQMRKKVVGTLVLVIGICLLVSPLVTAGWAWAAVSLWGLFMTALGIVILNAHKLSVKFAKLSKYAASFLSLCALLVALILEALPFGAVLIFADEQGQRNVSTFSYFSLIPYGYANFFPLITATLTVLLGVLSILILLRRLRALKLQNAVFICTVITFVCSVSPILYGIEYMSVTGAGISIMLLISILFQAFANRPSQSAGS